MKPRQQAREKAAQAGLLPFAAQLADLRDTSTLSNISSGQSLSASSGGAASVERSLITSSAGKSSGGINTASLSRDTGGGVTIGTIILRIIAFPLDREVLYVDDYRLSRQGRASDAMMDGRVSDMLESAGVDAQFKKDIWGPADLSQEPETIKLSEVARKLIGGSTWI